MEITTTQTAVQHDMGRVSHKRSRLLNGPSNGELRTNGTAHTNGHVPAELKSRKADRWYYPPELEHDLQDVDLPDSVKQEVFACAWEYTRCVIPQYTNWGRYVAFMRIIVMGIIAEFKGNMVDVAAGDEILGYNLSTVLSQLFEGTAGHQLMAREYRSFLLITADKASQRRDGQLFRRYVNALARSPRQWFRMRDADALARFTIASALACNDLDDMWFTDDQFEILTEIGDTAYDAVAFFKHRSEGETNSTFAYVPSDLRIGAFRRCREALWALDAAWARKPQYACVTNFVRFFGGPIHMMMRRYRFVEEGLTIGTPETEKVIQQTRKNVKLWNRVDANSGLAAQASDAERYRQLIERSEELMFTGLAEALEQEDRACAECVYRESYGAQHSHEFGGVKLCESCKDTFRRYTSSFNQRAIAAFPELKGVLLDC